MIIVVKIVLLPLSMAKKDVLLWTLTVKKENVILLPSLKSRRKRAKFRFADRIFFAVVRMLRGNLSRHFTIVKPETVLKWTRDLIKRYYVFFILYMKTREIVQYAVITNPCREFVRQQLIRISEKREDISDPRPATGVVFSLR